MAENGAVLGANGTAVSPAELPFVELGSSGLRQSGGFIREELLRELSGPRGMRVYVVSPGALSLRTSREKPCVWLI
jgi:hypothetical protein